MRRAVTGLLTATLLLAGGVAAQQKKQQEIDLQAAIRKETVDGDLNGAIKQYSAIVAKYKNDRAVTAMALIHMAECYQKLGDAESRKIYERIVKDYADQKEAVAIARQKLGGGPGTQNAGIVTRQVWTGPNVDAYGTVSPDGRVLSFTDWSTGDLALHDFTTGQDRRLTNKGTWNDSLEFALGSVISPDGRQVAYGWGALFASPSGKEPFFGVRLVDLNGGKPRVLSAHHDLEGAYVHDWSPDGKWLAVQLQRVDRTAQIGLVSTVDGALRVLRSIDWRGASKMAFSPDGKYLAYDLPVNDDSEQREIHVMAVDASREMPALANPGNDRVLGWSPDGKHLLFASDRSGLSGVWALPVSDGKPQGSPELIKPNISPRSLGLTRSGALYYSVVATGRDVYVASVDFETGKVLSPPTVLPQPYVGLNDFPQWSPDGKYLAYLSRRDSNSRSRQMTALAIRSMETGKVRELRPNLAYIYSDYARPLWSPEGSFLLVNGKDKKGRQGIYRIDAQNGEAAPLVLSEPGQGNVSAVGWLPNGTMLYIRRDLKPMVDTLFARDLQSGKERQILRRDRVGGVAVSPDGRLLAVTGFDRSTKSRSLLLVPAEGGEPRELLHLSDSGPETLGSFVAWLPDGKFLFFRKGPSDARETFRIPVEGGAPAKYGAEWTVGPPNINPDGRQVAFTMGEPKLEIWALENFLPKLSAKR